MNRLDRYIFATVARSLLLVLLVLLSLACLIEWMDQRSATTTLARALQFALLTLPRRAHELLPFVGLLGVLAGLGALAATHELTAARSVGHGVARIVGAALLPVAALVVVSSAITEWVMPAAESHIAVQRAQQRNGSIPARSIRAAVEPSALRWSRVVDHGREEFIAVSAIDERGQMFGVTGFSFSAGGLDALWQARQIDAARGASMTRVRRDWVVTEFADTPYRRSANPSAGTAGVGRDGAARHDAGRQGAGTTSGRVQQQSLWRVQLRPEDFEQRELRDAERMPLTLLGQIVRTAPMGAGSPLTRLFESVFWQRLAQPLEALLLAALGAGFVFGSLRVSGVGRRLALGVLVAILFKYVGDTITLLLLLTPWPTWWTALLPLLLLSALSGWSLRRSA